LEYWYFYLRSCRFRIPLMCQFNWELDCVGFGPQPSDRKRSWTQILSTQKCYTQPYRLRRPKCQNKHTPYLKKLFQGVPWLEGKK
jgi:hypothetical protein